MNSSIRSKQKETNYQLQKQILINLKQSAFHVLLFICAMALLTSLAGCDKDKDEGIDFSRAHNKKWQNVSSIPDPVWTDPNTGKTYNDLTKFEEEAFPCVRDDYAVYYSDGTTVSFHGTNRCYPGEPDKGPTGTYTFDKATDSLILYVPFEVPGQPVSTIIIRSKVLELTNDKMLLRFQQVLPFTNTRHTITYTYKAIP